MHSGPAFDCCRNRLSCIQPQPPRYQGLSFIRRLFCYPHCLLRCGCRSRPSSRCLGEVICHVDPCTCAIVPDSNSTPGGRRTRTLSAISIPLETREFWRSMPFAEKDSLCSCAVRLATSWPRCSSLSSECWGFSITGLNKSRAA